MPALRNSCTCSRSIARKCDIGPSNECIHKFDTCLQLGVILLLEMNIVLDQTVPPRSATMVVYWELLWVLRLCGCDHLFHSR